MIEAQTTLFPVCVAAGKIPDGSRWNGEDEGETCDVAEIDLDKNSSIRKAVKVRNGYLNA